jgi:hypothetical protein
MFNFHIEVDKFLKNLAAKCYTKAFDKYTY